MSPAHARVHALLKGQEEAIEVVLAKVKVLLVANDAHVVRQPCRNKVGMSKLPLESIILTRFVCYTAAHY